MHKSVTAATVKETVTGSVGAAEASEATGILERVAVLPLSGPENARSEPVLKG